MLDVPSVLATLVSEPDLFLINSIQYLPVVVPADQTIEEKTNDPENVAVVADGLLGG